VVLAMHLLQRQHYLHVRAKVIVRLLVNQQLVVAVQLLPAAHRFLVKDAINRSRGHSLAALKEMVVEFRPRGHCSAEWCCQEAPLQLADALHPMGHSAVLLPCSQMATAMDLLRCSVTHWKSFAKVWQSS
jgi:hypothetical protein